MVDDLLLQCVHKETAQEIHTLIALALQLENEDQPLFAYIDPCVDLKNFNCGFD